MRRTAIGFVCLVFFLTVLTPAVFAKKSPKDLRDSRFISTPHNPPNAGVQEGSSVFKSAAAGTTQLGWWQFDAINPNPPPGLLPDTQGWTSVDMTAQIKTYFHVDGPACNGVDAINGAQSMWCGEAANSGDPWCGWATLPGYGNNWSQALVTPEIAMPASMTYTAIWDSEPGYDYTYVQYWDDVAMQWVDDPNINAGQGSYNGTGGPIVETVVSGAMTTTKFRFNFVSDGGGSDKAGGSDEDGVYQSFEGAFKVDDITTTYGAGPTVTAEDFEGEACGALATHDGFWSAAPCEPYGLYAALYDNSSPWHINEQLQEDPCFIHRSHMWGFFDDPMTTNYACGGWPLQGAMPYGPDVNGLYMHNEIWSPWVANVGTGSNYILEFLVYRDLPLDNLQFYTWSIRTRDVTGCPSAWSISKDFYYGGSKDWHRERFHFGSLIDPGAVDIQVALGAVDMCGMWCGEYGTGACHSHAPLFDQVKLLRVPPVGPQWTVRLNQLFQDAFPEGGGITGTARADGGYDCDPNQNGWNQGDVAVVSVNDPEGLKPIGYGGYAIYAYVRGTRPTDPVTYYTGGEMISLDNRPDVGQRYHNLGSSGGGWYRYTVDQYHYDECEGTFSLMMPHHYCFDLRDALFEPGDKIEYFFGAENINDEWTYWSREHGGQGHGFVTTNKGVAEASPCEFRILPTSPEHSFLYVDDCDDEVAEDGTPIQLYFDTAFEDYLHIDDQVDRFDIVGASAGDGNSLGNLVTAAQLTASYGKIIWSTGTQFHSLLGDGGISLEGADDYQLLYDFLNTHTGDDPGVYLTGDNIAEEWEELTGQSALDFRVTFMNFNLVSGNHTQWPSNEPVSPALVRQTGSFFSSPSVLVSGGCPRIKDFDMLAPAGMAVMDYAYPVSGDGAVIHQITTPTAEDKTARVVLEGFSYHHIHDSGLPFPVASLTSSTAHPARVDHLRDVLIFLQTIVDEPVGADPLVFEYRLDDAYPNPFNPTTAIKYSIKDRTHVSLKVYNVAGQLVRTLVNEEQSPRAEGFSATWNGKSDAGQDVSSGVYFYKLATKGFTQTKKMVLLK